MNKIDTSKKKDNSKSAKKSQSSSLSDVKYVVPPGLFNEFNSFLDHFKVAGDSPIMIVGPTGVGKSMFLKVAKILFEEKTYRNGVDLAPSEAYQLLAKAPDKFTTSSSSPSDYADIFLDLSIKVQGIFCLAVSSKLSTTYNVACLARKADKTGTIPEQY